MSLIKLNRELEILLWVIKTKNSPDNSIFNKENFKTDWDILLTASLKHGILPILYKKLITLQKSTIPTSTLLKFRSFYLRILQNNLIRGDQLKKILKTFNDLNINIIPFKGPILSIQAYGDLGFRISADLDILINYKDFSRVYDTMIENEYKPSFPLSRNKKKMWIRARRDIEFFNSKSKIIIDMHQRLSQAHFSFGLSEEEKGENFIYLMDQKVKVLSPENTILYMCINHTKDQWNSLRMVSDLSFFLFTNPEIDWVKLIQKAKKMGILRMVLSGFLLLKELVDESFPDVIIHEMEKDKKVY